MNAATLAPDEIAVLREHLETVTTLLLDFPEPPPLCEVSAKDRPRLCDRPGAEEHVAEYEILFTCGEVGYCCTPVFERTLRTLEARDLNCPTHRIPVTLVTYTKLRP